MYHNIVKNKKYIGKVTDISGSQIQLSNSWQPKSVDEFIQIHLTSPLKLLKFVISDESNVRSWTIKLLGIKNGTTSYTAINGAEIDIFDHSEFIQSVKFKPLEKYDESKPLRIKLKIYACTGYFKFVII